MRPYSYMYCAPHRDGVLHRGSSRASHLRHNIIISKKNNVTFIQAFEQGYNRLIIREIYQNYFVNMEEIPLSKVGQESFPSEPARAARASMARGSVLFRVLVVQGIRA